MFEFQPDLTTNYKVSCHCMSKIYISTFYSVVIGLILVKVADNKGMHNILDVFKFRPVGPQTAELVAPDHLNLPLSTHYGENGVSTFLDINLRTIQNILMTIFAGFQVSDHCPLCYFKKTCKYYST